LWSKCIILRYSRYNLSLEHICSFDFNPNILQDHCTKSAVNDLPTVCFIVELLYVRDGHFTLPMFSKDDVISMLNFVCTV